MSCFFCPVDDYSSAIFHISHRSSYQKRRDRVLPMQSHGKSLSTYVVHHREPVLTAAKSGFGVFLLPVSEVEFCCCFFYRTPFFDSSSPLQYGALIRHPPFPLRLTSDQGCLNANKLALHRGSYPLSDIGQSRLCS